MYHRQGKFSAKAGQDYVAAEGVLTFLPGEKSKEIVIQIVDDDEPEADEEFEVSIACNGHRQPASPACRLPHPPNLTRPQICLATPRATAAAANDPKTTDFKWLKEHICKVLIIDDDRPGILRWQNAESIFEGGGNEVVLTVYRYDGNRGDLKFRVMTKSINDGRSAPAAEHKDYVPMDEVMVLRNTVRTNARIITTCEPRVVDG